MKRTAKKLELPKDFAQKLLDCEIEYKLSDRPSKQNVVNLIQLYTLGVEYYESIRSHKFLYFQLKMNEVFASSATMSSISEEKPEEAESPLKKKMRSDVQEQKILAFKIKQKQQKMLKEVEENTKQSVSANTVKKILNENDLKNLAHKEKIQAQIQNQDSILKEKIQRRKSRLLFSKSFTSANVSGQTETRDTLFPENLANQKNGEKKIKPIEVSFSSIINQNDSDEEADIARRMSIISNAQGKKAKSELDLFQKNQN